MIYFLTVRCEKKDVCHFRSHMEEKEQLQHFCEGMLILECGEETVL